MSIDSDGGVWSVNDSRLVRLKGRDWVTHYTEYGKTFYSVWARDPADMFAVGMEGLIVRYDGRTWDHMNSGTNETLYAVWGTSGEEVFAAGANGTVLVFNGKEWSTVETQVDTAFMSIHGCAVGGAWFVGAGQIMYLNETASR